MLFRATSVVFDKADDVFCLNLSCESNAFQGYQLESVSRNDEERLNLSCESNAFQGYVSRL